MNPQLSAPEEEEIATLQSVTNGLAGVATRGLEPPEDQLSLARFRMRAILDELGSSPSSAVARGTGASSATRPDGRLEAALRHFHDAVTRTHEEMEAGRDPRGPVRL
jgi:hypothetical protein